MSQILPTTATARRVDTPTGPIALLDTAGTGGAGDTGDHRETRASNAEDRGDAGRADRPAVLLVPGYTGSKEDFVPLLDPLADAGWRAVAMDQRGQFESPGVDDSAAYTVTALATDLLAVVADLGAPVHLLGHSFGGLVARAAVIAAPSSFTSLVLLDSGPDALGGARQQRMEAIRPLLAQGGMPAVYMAMEALAAGDPKWRGGPQALRAFLKRRFLASSPVALEGMGDALLREPDRVAELRATGVPALVAYGVADDAWSPAVQADMAERLGARRVVIPDAIHSPAIENTPATVRALADFWTAAESTGRPGPLAVEPHRLAGETAG